MIVDLGTLLLSDVLVMTAVTLAAAFFMLRHRTYEGFGAWMAGTLCLLVGYVSILFRGPAGPVPAGLSILLTNVAWAAAAVLRYDAVVRFLRGRAASRWWYVAAPVVGAWSVVTLGADWGQPLRNVGLSGAVVLLTALTAAVLLRETPEDARPVGRFMAAGNLLIVCELTLRAVFWMLHPDYALNSQHIVISGHFLVITPLDLALTVGFILLNYRRQESELRVAGRRLEEHVAQLRDALAEVRTLSGLLPICAGCKSIRDDQGYWHQVESYVSKHTDARFSHGLCPGCAQRLFPEFHPQGEPEGSGPAR